MADQPSGSGQARSAVVLRTPPHITDDKEWFIGELGRGNRRLLRVGEHVALNHPLARAWPDHFAPSIEPPDTWPIPVSTAEARQRQAAEATRLAPSHGRLIYPTCLRCGAKGEPIALSDPPTQASLINALSMVDEHDWPGRWKVEHEVAALARAANDQQRQLELREAAFRADHQRCPEGTDPLPEPAVPAAPVPLRFRSGSLRTVE